MIRILLITICLTAGNLGCGVSLLNSSSSSSPVIENHELVVLDSERLDRIPRFVTFQTPQYPSFAQAAGIEGTVWIKGLVNINGKLEEVSVYTTSGTLSLDEVAIQAASKCKLTPGRKDMLPVSVWIKYKVDFILDF